MSGWNISRLKRNFHMGGGGDSAGSSPDAATAGQTAPDGNVVGESPQAEMIKPAGGKVSSSGKMILADLAVYDALLRGADQIVAQIKNLGLKDARIALVDDLDFFSGDAQLALVEQQMKGYQELLGAQVKANDEHFNQAIRRITDRQTQDESFTLSGQPSDAQAGAAPMADLAGILGQFVSHATGVSGALTAASSVAAATATFLSYFQSELEIQGQEISPDVQAVQARLAGGLHGVHPVLLPGFHRLENSELLKNFLECLRLVQGLGAQLDGLKLLAAASKPGVGGGGDAPITANEAAASADQPVTLAGLAAARTENLIQQFGSFTQKIQQAPEDGGLSPLLSAALRQHLNAQKVTHLLYVGVVSSGGEAMTRTRLFRSAERNFLGGGNIVYWLVDNSGFLILANTQASLARFCLKLENDSLDSGLKRSSRTLND